MHYPLFLEFIGTSELLVLLFVALVIFGPRKLPEMGRSLGQALHQLRDASNDFKRTWEAEALAVSGDAAALTLPAPAPAEATAQSPAELAPAGDAAAKETVGEGHESAHDANIYADASHISPEAELAVGLS
jgi:TatA/E family protein of Tat protein translocase